MTTMKIMIMVIMIGPNGNNYCDNSYSSGPIKNYHGAVVFLD